MPYRRNRYRRKFGRRKASRGSFIARRNRRNYRKRLFRKKKFLLRRTLKTSDQPIKKFLFNGFCVASAASFTSDGTSATAPLVCPVMHNEHWVAGTLDTLPHGPYSNTCYRAYVQTLAAGGSVDTVAEALDHAEQMDYQDQCNGNTGARKLDVSSTSGGVTKAIALTQQDKRQTNRVLFRKLKLILQITPITANSSIKGHIEIGFTHGYPNQDCYTTDSQYLQLTDGWTEDIPGRYKDNDGFTAIYEKQWLDKRVWKSLYSRGFTIDGEKNESTTYHITVPFYKVLTYRSQQAVDLSSAYHDNSGQPYLDYDLMIDDRFPWTTTAPYMVIFNHNTANDFSVNCQCVCEYQDLPSDNLEQTSD